MRLKTAAADLHTPDAGGGSSRPLVSIIVPAYNAAAWLAETLESAFAQTWPAIEVIVVDDGSTDGTREIAERYAGRGIRIVSQENQGLSGARNSGLAVARGEYIQFLDADDLISPDKVEHQVRRLQREPRDAVATGRWGRFRQDPAKARFGASPHWRDQAPLEYLAHVARTGNPIPVHAWLLPRALVDRIGPFVRELRVMEDHEYFARVVLASAGLRFCSEGCSYYRSFHAHTLSKQRQASAFTAMFRSIELTVEHVLAAAPKREMRQVAADYYQWLVFKLYPDRPDLVRMAEERARALGGSTVRPLMGPRAQLLSRVIGWKAVQRVRAWLWSRDIYPGRSNFIAD